jgi:hypothetical protein
MDALLFLTRLLSLFSTGASQQKFNRAWLPAFDLPLSGSQNLSLFSLAPELPSSLRRNHEARHLIEFEAEDQYSFVQRHVPFHYPFLKRHSANRVSSDMDPGAAPEITQIVPGQSVFEEVRICSFFKE